MFRRGLAREDLGFAARRGVTEEHPAEALDVDLNGARPAGQHRPDLGPQLLRGPAHGVEIGLGQRTAGGRSPVGRRRRVRRGHLGQDGELAIAVDEAHRQVEIEQAPQRLARHRTGDHVAPHHDQIDRGGPHLLEHGVEGGEIAVNVEKAGDAPNTPAVAATPVSNVELEFWRSVKDSNKPDELNAYLSSYPNGTFKSLALARIASLQNGRSTTTRNLSTEVDPAIFTDEADQTSEDQIGLDKGRRRDVQRRLTGLGFDVKATGKFDDETRTVIKRWQTARGYPASGYLNKLQHKALLSEIVSARIGSTDDSASSDEPCRWSNGALNGS